MDVPHLNLALEDRSRENVNLLVEILNFIRPSWVIDNVKIEDLSMVGFVNVNFICRHKDDDADAIFIRINNEIMRSVYDDQLVLARKFVDKHQFSAKLLCTFENGFVEECLRGEAITWATKDRLKDETVQKAVIEEMVRYHSQEVLEDARQAGIQTDLPLFRKDWLDEMWKQIENGERVEENVLSSLPGKEYILRERQELISVMERLGARKAFCHSDINAANIYILPDGRSLFSDYETCCLSYVADEIGYYLFALNFEFEQANPFETYPDAEYRTRFCRQYLAAETYRRVGGTGTVTDVEELDVFEKQVAVGKLMAAESFIVYAYGFLAKTIFNTVVETEKTVRDIQGLWQIYQAEKKELLDTLNL